MSVQNSFLRSSGPLLTSIAALVLAAGCGAEDARGIEVKQNTGAIASTGAAATTAAVMTPAKTTAAAVTSSPANTMAVTPPVATSATPGGGAVTPPAATSAAAMPPTMPASSASASGAGTTPAPMMTAGGSTTPPAAGGAYNSGFVEFVGADCTVADPKDTDNEKLPDLFMKFDGTRMSKKSDWACRRAEIKKVVEKYIHGPKPGRPDTVTGSVSASSIKVHVEHGGKKIDFSVSVTMPSGAKMPAPIIIGLGGGSLDKAVLTAEGVASGNYSNNTLASETSRNGLFTDIYGTSTGASAQVGWAWGISRVIDVLVDEKKAGRNDIIDPTAVGITGCSRLGKGAFTIGAFDERIALGIPQESGTGGVSAFRVVNTAPMGPNGKPAQSLDSAWTEAQGWFGTAFGDYRKKVNVIPGDTHSLVAMYAPRGLLVLDNSRIGELGASAQHAASAAGAEVYKALGVGANIEYHGGNPTDPHNHCSFYASQAEPLKHAIRAFLTRKEDPSGKIEPQSAGTADLKKWIDWAAPVLE